MKQNEILPELFHKIEENFTQHLELEENERVLFSGVFGIGKTTFLKHYFGEKGQGINHNVVHLFPVNYSVLSNEDIFTYIKHDIIYELLLNNHLELEREEFSYLEELPDFAKANLTNYLSTFLLLIPKMGKQLFQFAEKQGGFLKKLKDLESEKNPETDAVTNLINNAIKPDGQLYEFNITTQIIFQTLKKIKQEGKKNILIIDDLDRIDPQHIFRLFNVFAAQFDRSFEAKGQNKFGFDHIIFVCDIKNIKNIYQHKYGVDTDFNGYVDKFYSREIFFFDNYENIISFLNNFYDSLNFIGETKEFSDYLKDDEFLKRRFVFISSNFLLNRQINLRSLIKNYNSEFHINKRIINSIKGEKIDDLKYSILHLVRLISILFIDGQALKRSIQNCGISQNLIPFSNETDDFIWGELFLGLNLLENNIRVEIASNPKNNKYLDLKENTSFEYRPFRDRSFGINSAEFINQNFYDSAKNYFVKELNSNSYFEYLGQLIEILISRNYLK